MANKAENQIANDEHDSITNAKRVSIVEGNVTINPGSINIANTSIVDSDTGDTAVVNPDGSLNSNLMDTTGSFIDPATKQLQTDIFNELKLKNYFTNNIQETSNYYYIGKQNKDGSWLIIYGDDVNGSIRYANVSNNSSYVTYDSAWTNKELLSFSKFGDLNFN